MESIGARIPPGLVTLTAAYVQTVLLSALSTYYNHLATHFVKKKKKNDRYNSNLS